DNDGTPDDCEIDCNANGTPDDCESITDCNNNGIPDECEADCDNDGIPDDCEADCNANGTPDDCEALTDCNFNGIPDECEPDCNSNSIPDDCDIASGTSNDCNNNGIPDSCDLTGGASQDCNLNGIPDECDIAIGLSLDLNANSVPDECEVDCNGNGIPDLNDLLSGTSQDANSNDIPDECEVIATAYGFCVSGPCGNDDPGAGCATSLGAGVLLSASGSGSVALDNLTLSMGPMPVNTFGIFYNGPIAGSGTPFGDGLRLVLGTTNRFPVLNSGATGVISFSSVVGYSLTSFPASGQIAAGSTWNFQGWFRDPAGPCGTAYNLSQGLTILFTP
ncbi:MAG: hypothetical protein ACI841_003005, partial [Planctomycetota bacterium]